MKEIVLCTVFYQKSLCRHDLKIKKSDIQTKLGQSDPHLVLTKLTWKYIPAGGVPPKRTVAYSFLKTLYAIRKSKL